MASAGVSQVIRTGGTARAIIIVTLIVFALFYLLPLYVMLANSLKPLKP
jgi:glucose/mannose transport system permease protein